MYVCCVCDMWKCQAAASAGVAPFLLHLQSRAHPHTKTYTTMAALPWTSARWCWPWSCTSARCCRPRRRRYVYMYAFVYVCVCISTVCACMRGPIDLSIRPPHPITTWTQSYSFLLHIIKYRWHGRSRASIGTSRRASSSSCSAWGRTLPPACPRPASGSRRRRMGCEMGRRGLCV